jgi:hypothetical protein
MLQIGVGDTLSFPQHLIASCKAFVEHSDDCDSCNQV